METISEYLMTFLLNAGWQIAVVVALSTLADRLLRNGPARYRQLIWVAALVASIGVPIYSTLKPAVTASMSVNVPAPLLETAGSTSTSTAGRCLSTHRPHLRLSVSSQSLAAL